VKFRLGGDQGLDILAAGYPLSRRIACDSQAPIEETVTDSGAAYSTTPNRTSTGTSGRHRSPGTGPAGSWS
jgi:hypothetical protein